LVVATTPLQLDVIVNNYNAPPETVCLIPTGYDDNRFFPVGDAMRETIRQRLNFTGLVVLATGRPARNKGHDLLIDAFTLLARREPRAMLHLAIDGADLNTSETLQLEELRERAQATGVADRIVFESCVPDEHLADLYRAADLFVLSSRYESFGTTAIEAMASGTPTVVTVHGGLYLTLSFGRHALFADPFDREDLGITMAKVFRHPRLRARLAIMGAHHARSLFTWTAVAQQLIASVVHRPNDLAPHDLALDEATNLSV
jgi:mannosylfructose-phosphate synthase